jgi:uncharacterized Fe-S cluster-containing radical SAM superfamily protein
MPTPRDWRLLYRGSDEYLRLNSAGITAIQDCVQFGRDLSPLIRDTAEARWGIDVSGSADQLVQVRQRTPWLYENASWELNLRCNYDCEHCYLGPKPSDTLTLQQRKRVIHALAELGVYRLQITGGEPLIDRWFTPTYRLAAAAGIVMRISTNGSQLHRQRLLDLFTEIPPTHITVSLYGATAESYESLTCTPAGTFARYERGISAAAERGINLHFNIIVTRHNEHERAAMVAWAERFSPHVAVFDKLSATIHGTGEVLDSQAVGVEIGRKSASTNIFTNCNAGTTFFHVDPLGRASICKVGRDPYVQLDEVGAAGMAAMTEISTQLLTRAGGCTSCGIQSTCSTCPPVVVTYRAAGAPNAFYCQYP